jgi:hypothetical protein
MFLQSDNVSFSGYRTGSQSRFFPYPAAGMFLLHLLKSSCMNVISKILLIALICVAASANQAFAQKKRAGKTSSAKAYYGQTPSKPNYKPKKNKMSKSARSQSMKRARTDARNKKKYS